MTDIHNMGTDTPVVEPAEPPSDKAIIDLANHLLQEFSIPTRLEDVCDISASLFVVLYESLFSDRLPGIIRQPVSEEDEIHNCQIVIDVLSTEVVKDSLSHISGVDIVAGDSTAILNLLDVFSYLLEYVLKRIEDDTESVATTEPEQSSVTQTEDKIPTKVMKDLPKSKMGSTASSNTTNNNSGAQLETNEKEKIYSNRNDNRRAFSCRDVITHEDFYAMSYGGIPPKTVDARPPSPIRPDASQSLLGHGTIESDFDTDVVDLIEPARDQPKIAWESKSAGPSEIVIDGVTLRAMSQPSSKVPWESTAYRSERPIPSLSASMPAPRSHEDHGTGRDEPLRNTVGPISYHAHTPPGKTKINSSPQRVKGLSSSYNDLRELVEKTAALTHVALATSPVRARTATDLDVTDYSINSARPAISSNGARWAKELNARGLRSTHSARETKTSAKPSKKVAFASMKDSGSIDYLQDPYDVLLSGWHGSSGGYASDLDSDYLNRDSPVSRGRQAVIPSKTKKAGPKKSASLAGVNKKQQFAKYLAQNRQPELGAAHMTLLKEDRALHGKQELLRKFYEQDHQEFAEDVEFMLERDRQKSNELEAECIKKRTAGPLNKKMKAAKASSSIQLQKKSRTTKSAGVKAGFKSRSKESLTSASAMPLCVESEEDLLPALLEEFPHLHLSENTWHELWRRGLHQIEALTRSHQESQRKKSRAQCQLEEAAERHELLANMMKKQLDHAKRLREIKEQKQQQISTRNKVHEKRIQSARARRYYNEYQVRARAKQLKRRTKEEMVFRDLFKDALNIQKERIRDVRQYASDQRKKQESKRQDEIDSLENFYHDQFIMLAEKLSRERTETELRDAEQQKIMMQLKRELRKKMESEIQLYQEQLFRDDDDVHFRKCDADRVLKQLHLAKYSAKI